MPRPTRSRSKSTNDIVEEQAATASRRTSSRSNKFACSMKEPSEKDLLTAGRLSLELPPRPKSRSRSKSQPRRKSSGGSGSGTTKRKSDSISKSSSKSARSTRAKTRSDSKSNTSQKSQRQLRQQKRQQKYSTPRSKKASNNSSLTSSAASRNTKSPAVRHSKARRQMKVETQTLSSDSDENGDEDDGGEDDGDYDGDYEAIEEGEDEGEDEDDDTSDSDGNLSSNTSQNYDPSASGSESGSESESESSYGDQEEESEIKIQRIIAVRSESKRKWKEICKAIQTSEVENGSRWFQEDDDDQNEINNGGLDGETTPMDIDEKKKDNTHQCSDDIFEERFLVKWSDLSFLHCSWETKEDLIEQVDGAKTYLSTFFRKSINGFLYDSDDRLDGDYFDPGYVQIDRVLESIIPESMQEEKLKRKRRGSRGVKRSDEKEDWGIIFDKTHEDYDVELGRQFLIKWGNTSYSEATYEYERDLILMDIEYQSHVESFMKRNKKPTKAAMKKNFAAEEEERRRLYKIFGDRIHDGEEKESNIEKYKKQLEATTFQNGGQLRDYQAEGVSWLLANHINKRSAILADEMGLGKTIQTAAYIYRVSTALHVRGPFLIVAPLSTIPHWQREFSGWTDLNTIVYHGSAKDREVIREYEFPFECDRPQDSVGMNQRYLKKCHHRSASRAEKTWMAQVLITTPEMLVTDDFNELKEVKWEVLVVDEAHRLKNHNSKLALNLRSSGFDFKHTLLLTGTPIQNNMNEMWTLMNFINPTEFSSCENFMELYGNMRSKEHVDRLHGVIRPYILRRLKEDVEKSVPPKEETLIEVELTMLQKQYYRALYEKNVQFLHRDLKKALDGPSINNLAMQLRKCCNHPFLLNGVEEKVKKGVELQSMEEEADFLAKSSGKLVLLDKLLPKLKEGGHRLLIFSQFKIMLDILEDYLALRKFKFERIDGSITGKKRQMAIDRYQSKASMDSSFIMLLSTRAGGVGINLTAADTCIIFDSDWNPQNDLQAQARCHRIGQTKSVKVYRLLTRKTYEMQMFHMSSLKMGLDQAVLQGIENGTGSDQNLSKEEVEKLLRCGAYDIFREEQDGVSEKESNDFIEQDIDSILARRTKTVIHDNTGSNSNAAGGTFSKASFNAKRGASAPGKDVDIDDPDFWTKMVGEAKATNDDDHISSGKKRIRKKANYNEQLIASELDRHLLSGSESEGVDSSSSYESESDDSITMDQACEYNLNSESVLQNSLLQGLLNIKRQQRLVSERRRWGGTSATEWAKSDVEVVLKLLHKFGINNNNFVENFQKEASKMYDEDEINRMCYTLTLTNLLETVHADVGEVAKRIERTEQKKIEKTQENIESALASPSPATNEDVNSIEWKEKQLSLSFNKFWTSNKWAADALLGIISISETRPPRDISTLQNDDVANSTPLLDAFIENIWPALKTRGWQEHIIDDDDRERRTWLSSAGETHRYAAEILDKLPSMYPELSETVTSVIISVSKRVQLNDTLSQIQGNKIAIKPSGVDMKSIEILLQQYGPMQLLMDRQRQKLISLPRKNLDVLSYLHNAHFLVNHVNASPNVSSLSTVEKYDKLSKLLVVNPKASLPHPSWKIIHDAILVSAIAKHGWIGKDDNCRAITNDESIEWGKPFDEGDVSLPSSSNTDSSLQNMNDVVDKVELKKVASRVVDFMNDQIDTKELKGFNLNLVLKSYGIVAFMVTDDDGQVEKSWRVDSALSDTIAEVNGSTSGINNSSKTDPHAELPPRKDLLKRAKTILSKSSESAIFSGEDKKKVTESVAHQFVILDQGNILNVFLAELLREVVKQTQKTTKMGRKAISLAITEIQHRMKSITDVSERADFTRLGGHIALVERNMRKKCPSRAVKNVIRAILGIKLVSPTNPEDEMFVLDDKASVTPSSKKNESGGKTKSTTKRVNESAAGDLAINKAISAAKQRVKNGDFHDVRVMLGITTIETLILSVMCSQGIPLYSDDWENALNSADDDMCENDYLISWFHMGNVLEVAAEKWVEISQMHLNKAKQGGFDTAHLEVELNARQSAHKEAMRLHQKPIYLAKKTIMLIEAIRLHMGAESKHKGKNGMKPEHGLGSRVLCWNKNHLVKWAKAMAVFKEGQTMHATVMSIRPDSIPAGFLDKKYCKAIFTQISQQTRLRSLFVKYGETELSPMVSKAVKNVRKNGDAWDGRPSWWKNQSKKSSDDFDLLSGVLRFGYGGFDQMLRDNEHFCKYIDNGNDRLYRSSGQQRVNCITRELSGMDDSAETMRLMNERKNRLLQPNDQRVNIGNSIQVGIDAFFTPSAPKAKHGDTPTTNGGNSDDSEIVVLAVVSPKRKEQMTSSPNINSLKKRKI